MCPAYSEIDHESRPAQPRSRHFGAGIGSVVGQPHRAQGNSLPSVEATVVRAGYGNVRLGGVIWRNARVSGGIEVNVQVGSSEESTSYDLLVLADQAVIGGQ